MHTAVPACCDCCHCLTAVIFTAAAADGLVDLHQTPGNPHFLGHWSNKVRDAEMALIFAINFDFNVEVPVSMAVWELNELDLTEAAAERDPRLLKVRQYTVQLCAKR